VINSQYEDIAKGVINLHPFPVGTKVETNKDYFNLLGRKVIGESVTFNPMPPDEITIVKWLHQEGNIIPEHQDNAVLMMSKDLQKHSPH
jgi:hypothetical protein